MIPAFSPFLALRYLVKRRINVLGVIGVAFAVWAMLVVDGVFTGFVSDIRDNVRSSAPPLLLTDLPHDTGYGPLRDALEADEDVVVTAPRLRHHGMVQPQRTPQVFAPTQESSQLEFDHTENGFALLLGIDPLLEPQVLDVGGWLRRGPEELARYGYRIDPSSVLDEPQDRRRSRLLLPDRVEWRARRDAGLPTTRTADEHTSKWPGMLVGWRRVVNLRGVRPGDPLDLLCAAFPRVDENGAAVLRVQQDRVAFAGFFGSGNRVFDETTALLPIETLRTLLGHDYYDPNSIALVTDVAIRPRDGLSASELTALKRRLADKVQPLLGEGAGPCAVLDWQEQNSVFLSAVAQEQALMQIVLFVVMLVSAFVIYATLHMMVVQKVKDIGIVTAVGGAPGGIGAVFVISGLVVAVLGAGLGVAAGLLSARWLNPVNDWVYEISDGTLELFPRRLFDLDRIPCDIEPSWVVTVAVGAVVLALAVAFVPARRAARLNPVTALSFE